MSRRAAGEGSIYPVPGGHRGSVELPAGPDGRRRRRVVTGATAREVGDKMVALRRAVAEGTLSVGPDMTVAGWLDHWLGSVAVLRSTTRVGYESKIRVRVVPYIGATRLDRLTPEHLERLYATLLADGLSASSVIQVHRILHRALRVAEQRRRIPRNPASLVSPPSRPHREAVALSRPQAVAALGAAGRRRSAPRWQVALSMGLRQGEALGLCWDAVDLGAGTLAVSSELVWLPYRHGCATPCGRRARWCPSRSGGVHVLEEPKSARSRRTLPLPGQLVDALKAWRVAQLEERLALGEDWRGSGVNIGDTSTGVNIGDTSKGADLVFAQPNGRPVDSRADWQDWQDILAEAGVPRMGTHGGRHTTATLMLEAGESMKVVQDWLGHSTMALTADVYSHVAMGLKRGAAKSIGGALWGETS